MLLQLLVPNTSESATDPTGKTYIYIEKTPASDHHRIVEVGKDVLRLSSPNPLLSSKSLPNTLSTLDWTIPKNERLFRQPSCHGLTLAQGQAPTRVAHSHSPATAGQRREKKKNIHGGFISETRTEKHFKGKTGSTLGAKENLLPRQSEEDNEK